MVRSSAVGEGRPTGAAALERVVGLVLDAFAVGSVAVEAEFLINGFAGMILEVGHAFGERGGERDGEEGREKEDGGGAFHACKGSLRRKIALVRVRILGGDSTRSGGKIARVRFRLVKLARPAFRMLF